jgi:hypothetical protein
MRTLRRRWYQTRGDPAPQMGMGGGMGKDAEAVELVESGTGMEEGMGEGRKVWACCWTRR